VPIPAKQERGPSPTIHSSPNELCELVGFHLHHAETTVVETREVACIFKPLNACCEQNGLAKRPPGSQGGAVKLLILGGTVFLGRAIARHAVAAGHDVTCATRGQSGEPPAGVEFVRIDRSVPEGMTDLTGTYDAVIDVARQPSQVRHAIAALQKRVGHWSFVSSCSVYAKADVAFPKNSPLHEAAGPDVDESSMEYYGPLKVACENAVLEVGLPSLIDRAGLIVGPEDSSNRFAYWVSRFERGGEILAPGTPDDYVQWIDVRDLAAWHVEAAETGQTGIVEGVGKPVSRAEFFQGLADGTGTSPRLTWVDQDFLAAQEVEPWMGPKSLPMWLPLPEYAGFMTRDHEGAAAIGLTQRPLADTARDTLAWLHEGNADQGRAGLTAEEEEVVLAAWKAR
jgi:2'-hydroxyisoflavone reductase